MESYTDFAYLYDVFMEDVPYEEWTDLLSSLLGAYGENIKTVIDLGCGTGNITELLYDKGYSMIGVDLSEDMLSVAMDKSFESGKDILYVNQDMRSLELLEPADAVISICDCINYLMLDEDVEETFAHVYKCLNNGGLFIFDFNTIYKYETVIGDTTIAENREDCSFIWENYYNPEDHINEYDVTFFVKDDSFFEGSKENSHASSANADMELFRRFTETHLQRGYDFDEMKRFVENAGFKFVTAIDEESKKKPVDTSERIYMVCRK